MKHILLTVLAVFTFNVNAVTITEGTSDYLDSVFVSYGQYHRDTTTNLEWLDFSDLVDTGVDKVTLQYTVQGAEDWYGPQGWRLATTTEVYDLFTLFFPTYNGGTDGRMELDDYADPAADLIEARNSWLFAFGTSVKPTDGSDFEVGAANLFSYGLYVDDVTNKVQYLGANILPGSDADLTSFIYGPDNATGDLGRYTSYTNAGVFMVRDYTVVPIPAAIWLFGTGLIALLGFARRKV